MRKALALAAFIGIALSSAARKKPLDHNAYDSWQSVASVALSDDGKVVSYSITPQQGDCELFFENLSDGRKISVPRGGDPSFTYDSGWAVFTIKAPYSATRAAKIKKKKPDQMPKDSLGYLNLKTFELEKIPDAGKFTLSQEGDFVLAYEIKKKETRSLVVVERGSGPDTLKNIDKYSLDRRGRKLVVVFKKDKKDSLSSDRVVLYSFPGLKQVAVLSEGSGFYGEPRFNDGSDKIAFLSSPDSCKTGSKRCGIVLYEEIMKGKGRNARKETGVRVIEPEGCPEGWCIAENSPVKFSRTSGRLFVGISETVPPDDTTLVDFETAKLDIWNYDQYLTPPIQKARKGQLKDRSCLSVIDLKNPSRLVPLTLSVDERIQLIDGGDGDWAVVSDRAPYQLDASWDENEFHDVYLVSLLDGSRKAVFTALNGSPSLSPGGKYICWYDSGDLDWHTYRLSDGKSVNLTSGVPGMFHDDEDDHPMPSPAFDRPVWIEGDKAVLITEKYDIFSFSPDGGKPVCLTEGAGSRDEQKYRITFLSRSGISPALAEVGVVRTLKNDDALCLTVFDRETKENGYALVNAGKAGILTSFTAQKSFQNAVKAFSADVIAYRKGDFNNPMDLYVTDDNWKSERKLSSINPQQKEYNWGNVRLVHWTAYDGTELDGILITPEDLDASAKYPMISYFYEKNSQNLYSHYSPSPSRSVINFPFYASRGYVVFIPDVKYVPGHPGESAYNCICSGVEAMCREFPFIDKDRLGIQGQSWGGYQTAYLVTRTDMFAAAGSGAPVGNMTSAYGGIRWGSGVVRAMQYEHGQSRIGKSLWDDGGLELYIENSPVFHVQNVTTPVLIMHNDADGAVPWYQGIEFFMALRRFHHPCWLLEYNDEEHNLSQRKNSKDLSIRLQQFFDHYLKGEPMPVWMKEGVPVSRKGQYFGFEAAE